MGTSASSGLTRRNGCLLGVMAMLAVCAALAVGAYFFLSRAAAQSTLVIISNPETGSVVPVNNPIQLSAYAEAAGPLVRLEVYADGALIAAQDAQGDGENQLGVAQLWTPLTPGRHVLLARAYDSRRQISDSSVVFVDVGELSQASLDVNVDDIQHGDAAAFSLNDLANAAGTTPDALRSLNPDLGDPAAPIPPGTVIHIPRPTDAPRPPAPSPDSMPGAPDGPSFSGETHTCSQVNLQWGDVSNESGYAIYRLSPGESSFTLLERLPANSTTYADAVHNPGLYRYMLTAVRNGIESPGALRAVELGPECSPPAPAGTTRLRLILLNLTTAQPYSGVYCYVSVDGSRYERLPIEPDVLRASAGGLSYNLPIQLPNRGRYELDVPSDGLVRLEGDCWGHSGALSVLIGHFSASHARDEWDNRDLLQTAYVPGRQLASADAIRPDGGGRSGGENLRIQYRIGPPVDVTTIINPGIAGSLLLRPESLTPLYGGGGPRVPVPTRLRVTGMEIPCDDVILNPQEGSSVQGICAETRHLEWDWTGNALFDGRALTGFHASVRITDTANPAGGSRLFEEFDVRPGSARSSRPPRVSSRFACGFRFTITLRALAGTLSSADSDPLVINSRPCADTARLVGTITSIEIGPNAARHEVLDDGDICVFCADRRMELTGMLQSWDSMEARSINNEALNIFGVCPSQTLCQGQGSYAAGALGSGASDVITVHAGYNPIGFGVSLIDRDILNSSDTWCEGSAFLPRHTLVEWQRFDQDFTITGDFGESSCRVTVHVTGRPGR